MKLLLLQIDGLSRSELEWSMTAGHLPFLHGLSRSSHPLRSLYSGLPSTTPAFQGELFYGVRQCVCAWNFRDRHSGRIADLFQRPVAARREYGLRKRGRGLLEGGSAYVCLLSGGASEAHFCSGSERWLQGWPPLAAGQCAFEALRALAQTDWRQWRLEMRNLPKRVAVNVLLHKHLLRRVKADLRRGLPIIYANWLDYDGLAHLRGPHDDYARQVLPLLDDHLCQLWKLAQAEGYEVWIFSDHGQEECSFLALPMEGMQVADCGPLAHLYFDHGQPGELARKLVEQGVPQLIYWEGGRVLARNLRGLFELPEAWEAVLGSSHPFGAEAGLDLARMAFHPEAGRLIALGWDQGVSVSFAQERGCHGGAGPLETHAFALLPQTVGSVLRPLDLRREALRVRGQRERKAKLFGWCGLPTN